MSIVAQTTTGDLDLTTGNLQIITTPADEVALRLTNRFRLFKGEWFLDPDQGTPYFGYILGTKNPNVPLLTRLFTAIIEGTPGVESAQEVTVTVDPATRHLSTTFVAKAQAGAILQGQLGEPFVVVVQ